ncbi:MAG: TolC family protein [Bacteroidales bacterium]|nr:TolC family protein [Bacteroidales bacterium]
MKLTRSNLWHKWFQTGLSLLLTVAGSQVTAQEQKVWSLEDCITYALDNNIDIKKQQLNLDLMDETLLQSKLGMLPSLNGYAYHGYNWGKRVDPFTNEFATDRVRSNNFYASADFTIFDGFQKLNTVRQNQLELLATRYDLDAFMDDISVMVATYYLQVLYYMELQGIARNQLEITTLQVERTSKLVEAGTLAKGDLLVIEAQMATEQLARVQAENNLSLALLNLTQLLELPTPEGFSIEKPELGLLEMPEQVLKPEEVFGYAVMNRPEIKSAELRVESYDKGLSIAKGSLSPRLSLSGSYGTGFSGANQVGIDPVTFTPVIGITEISGEKVYSISDYTTYSSYETKGFRDQLSDNVNRALGFSLNVPIFNGWTGRYTIARAKIQQEQAQHDLKLKKNTLYKTIQQAYNDALSALKQHEAAAKKVNSTRESFKYSEQKFNVGMINSVDYNNAKKELNNAESELLQARYDFVFRTTILDFYMGKPLTLKR